MLTSWLAQLAARAASSVASLLSVAVLSQQLGVAGFGEWTIVVAWVGLMMPFADLGLPSTILRDAGGEQDGGVELRSRAGAALALQLALPLLVAPVAAVAGFMVLGQSLPALLVAAASLLPTALYTVLQIPFAASRRFKETAVVEAVARVATAGVTVLLVTAGWRLPWLLVVLSLPSVLGLMGLVLLRHRVPWPRPRFDVQLMRLLLRRGFPVMASLALFAVYLRVDAILLALLVTREEVGIYGLAYRVVEVVLAVPSLFLVVVYPRLVAVRHDRPDLVRMVGLSARALAVAGTPVLVVALVAGDNVMRLLGGGAFEGGGLVLGILLASTAISFGTALLGQLLILLDQARFLFVFSLGNVTLNIAMNLVLIPLAGVEGAAASTLVTETVAVVVVGRRLVRSGVLQVPWGVVARVLVSAATGSLAWVATEPAGAAAAVLVSAFSTALALRVSGAVTPRLVREAIGGRA